MHCVLVCALRIAIFPILFVEPQALTDYSTLERIVWYRGTRWFTIGISQAPNEYATSHLGPLDSGASRYPTQPVPFVSLFELYWFPDFSFDCPLRQHLSCCNTTGRPGVVLSFYKEVNLFARDHQRSFKSSTTLETRNLVPVPQSLAQEYKFQHWRSISRRSPSTNLHAQSLTSATILSSLSHNRTRLTILSIKSML